MADTRISDVEEDFDESLEDGDDSEYDYTGEESNLEEGAVEERCRFDWQDDDEEDRQSSDRGTSICNLHPKYDRTVIDWHMIFNLSNVYLS